MTSLKWYIQKNDACRGFKSLAQSDDIFVIHSK